MGRFINLEGQEFGEWVVLYFSVLNKHKQAIWHCRCKCGTERDVLANSLRNGTSTSCGHYQKETAILMGVGNRTHGKTHTRAFKAWCSMIQRCFNPNHKSYKYYGGREVPITVCERWLGPNGFINFYFDMCTSKGLEDVPEGLSLDRLDNNGNYEPENCRWATPYEQIHNRRCNKIKDKEE